MGCRGTGSGGGREIRNRVDVPPPPVVEAEVGKGAGGGWASRKGGMGRRRAVVKDTVELELKTEPELGHTRLGMSEGDG